MDSVEFIDGFFAELKRVTEEISRDDIHRAADLLYETWQNDGAVYVMGNGGSASTATHFTCDMAKVTIVGDKKRLKVMGLNDNIPLVSAWTNDSGFGSIFAEQLRPWIKEGDLLVGFSVHGGSGEGDAGPWSQNLVKAMRLAKDRGARVLGFSGFDGGAMKEMGDVCVVVPIASEPLGTPIVEAFHVVLHHLLAVSLRDRIARTEG